MQPQLLHNDGRGGFNDVSYRAGPYFSQRCLGRGVAAADYDNDGDTDLAVAHLDRPLALLRNETVTARHFLGLQLETSHRVPPVGGRVVVTAGGRKQVQAVVSGGSYQSASDTRLLFGLGNAAVADQVQIYWPSGRVDDLAQVAGDRYWIVVEGRQPRSVRAKAGE